VVTDVVDTGAPALGGVTEGGAVTAGAGLLLSAGTPGSALRRRGEAARDKETLKRIGKKRFRLVIRQKVKAFLRF
jgi:hypothetical protein